MFNFKIYEFDITLKIYSFDFEKIYSVNFITDIFRTVHLQFFSTRFGNFTDFFVLFVFFFLPDAFHQKQHNSIRNDWQSWQQACSSFYDFKKNSKNTLWSFLGDVSYKFS